VSPENGIGEWTTALTTLKPPPNAAELRRNIFGHRPLDSAVLNPKGDTGTPTAGDTAEVFVLSSDEGTPRNGVTLDGIGVIRHNITNNPDIDASDNIAAMTTLRTTCSAHVAPCLACPLSGSPKQTSHSHDLARLLNRSIIRRDGADIPEARNDRGEHVVKSQIEKVRV
jgi:hypothetical protein